ncbi:hypothetical protein [Plesiomonas shigelloides]|nr:hypothetical protein [Plesiomonas shigelloides]
MAHHDAPINGGQPYFPSAVTGFPLAAEAACFNHARTLCISHT